MATAFAFVCLVSVFPHDTCISKTDATRSPNLTDKMSHGGNPFILESKGQCINVTHKNTAGVGFCTLVSAGFF